MSNHYFKIKMLKLGKWALLPLDSETWHGEHTSRYFKNLFGTPKAILAIHTLDDGYQHMYAPESYVRQLHKRIAYITKKDYKGLEKKLKTFYHLVPAATKKVSKKVDPSKLSNRQLIKYFLVIRDCIHQLAIYDQFSWIGEEYWTPLMEDVLVNRLGLQKNSTEYNRVLFALTKPKKVSTTLKEKAAVALQTLLVKQHKTTADAAAKKLAEAYGWLPVFTFGEPWGAKHYLQELREKALLPKSNLKKEYSQIYDYGKFRSREIKDIVKTYHVDRKGLQIFIDFGLAIDTRNEAEYFVSFGSYFLMPLYREIAKRLFVSVNQLRTLTEKELVLAMQGKADVISILENKGKFVGWGFNQKTRRINFTSEETKRLFKYLESRVKPMQGQNEHQGTCASPGKATGKIRIIPYPADNHKVKQGDILVTYATTTDYLPAMKRAGAIITEVGGLTCHAAVVSREFGIPCIVALKNAMTNFKDGDLVEVDANKGIIKKL